MGIESEFSFFDRIRLRISRRLMWILLVYFPKEPSILSRLGTIEWAFGDYESADRLLKASLEVNAAQPEIWYRRGQVLESLDRRTEALQCYARAIHLQPEFEQALAAKRQLMTRMDQRIERRAKLKSAKSLKSKDPEACLNKGIELLESARAEEALRYFERAIVLDPKNDNAFNSQGLALATLKRQKEALASFEQAIALNRRLGEAHRNKGMVLLDLGRFPEALASTDRAIEADTADLQARFNRGHVLRLFNRLDEAIIEFDRVIAAKPDDFQAYWAKAMCTLAAGNLAEGFSLYEWRWQKAGMSHPSQYLNVDWPVWLGAEPLTGKTVLVAHEQGLGDMIQFCRYVPKLRAAGAQPIVLAPKELRPLLSTLDGIDVVSLGEMVPKCDYLCSVASLPLAFKTTLATVPADIPYLRVDTAKQQEWSERLGSSDRMRVGLAWSGHAVHENDRNRSIPLSTISPMLDLPIDFHVLQKDVRPEDVPALSKRSNVRLHQPELRDFADTAALITEMDLVISVDTAAVHLAGALGKKVWVMLPYTPDWRWMLNRTDSPWYPTATLFRQSKFGDWPSVLSKICAQLSEMAAIKVQ